MNYPQTPVCFEITCIYLEIVSDHVSARPEIIIPAYPYGVFTYYGPGNHLYGNILCSMGNIF